MLSRKTVTIFQMVDAINAYWKRAGQEANARVSEIKVKNGRDKDRYEHCIVSDVKSTWQPPRQGVRR